MNKEKNFVSAVIYVHNSEKEITDFVKNVAAVLGENFEKSEIICVNDFSCDNSVQKIKELSKEIKSPAISILNMSYFHGLELSMTAGVDLSIGDFVFEFDSALLDFEKSEIMTVYRKSLEGFDIVSASSRKNQRVSSSFFYYIFNKFSNFNYKMMTERFRILSRRVINRISSMNRTMPYRKPVYANCGLRTENIIYEPITDLREKEDSYEKKYRKSLATDSFIIFTDFGYRISLFITSVMLFFTLAVGIYSLVYHFLKNPVAGWTSTILFMSISMFFIFMILTFVLKYLQILVNLVFKRTKYNFESIEKLTK
ncbi:MAG: glycosyltransferase [Treponemataceae bacterium]|nr:glycosyltransferase [Treponemataceae bacterium]